jgi:pimeloyl-ACP methyl ester carboxylesterase
LLQRSKFSPPDVGALTSGKLESNMNSLMPTPPTEAFSLLDPFGFGRAAFDYWRDAVERSVLYMDVMRERGNQYLEHIEKTKPNVLGFDAEVVMDGRSLPRPVNYELMRILPPPGVEVDPESRPFVVVDPRAGHGPGIGGFKPDSEVGVALRAGHPCYFIGFLPYPEPGQTVEDVVEAEIAFLRRVVELHPASCEKPMVVGNCQAGWQIMMAASLEPEVFGPILIAGAPLSYWAGERGKAPMRYTGGMTGGSWTTALASDLGNGLFDGALLVQNFERLNLANTWWDKQYRLYANVDTEAERYLHFERWWGGHVVLGGEEIQYIVDNLFVGNRLSTAQLVTSDGRRIDLRNVRSPVVVFCSQGDDITPPPQALGWVRDLYESVDDIIASEQTIVYCVHDTTGHLGIFVSGSVSRKEHAEFTANIDYIDVLPPGLYETTVTSAAERDDAELLERDYLLEFKARSIEGLNRDVLHHREDDDARFATVARISEINLGLYRLFVQPWIRAVMTTEAARLARRMHPIRLGYKLLSDRNPLSVPLPVLAEWVRQDRHPVGEDNLLRALELATSRQISRGLDTWREARDQSIEHTFLSIYGQPLLQAMVGLSGDAHVHRRQPGSEPEHRRFIERRQDELRERVAEGGIHEAVMRSVIHVLGGAPTTDERNFKRLRASRAELEPGSSLSDFKHLVREQFFILKLDREAALAAIPQLLAKERAEAIRASLEHIDHVLAASGELSEHASKRYEHIQGLFAQALERVDPTERRQALADLHEEVATGAKAETTARNEVQKLLTADAETATTGKAAPGSDSKAAAQGTAKRVTKKTAKPDADSQSGDSPSKATAKETAPRRTRKR